MAKFKSNILFDVLGNILTSKSIDLYNEHIDSEDFKNASKFMVLRYLTMITNTNVRQVILDNYITLERMPDSILYRWCITNIPKQSSSFIKYIK